MPTTSIAWRWCSERSKARRRVNGYRSWFEGETVSWRHQQIASPNAIKKKGASGRLSPLRPHAKPMTTNQGAPRLNYQRRLLSVALTFGIVISTFYVLSKGEQFFVPLVMAVLAVYLVDIVSRLIRKIQIAGHPVPGVLSVILAFGIIFGLGFALIEIVAQNAFHVAAAAPKYQARLQQLQGEIFSKVGIEEPPELRELVKDG